MARGPRRPSLFLTFALLHIPTSVYAGETVVLPESISIKLVMMSYVGHRRERDASLHLSRVPSGYVLHSERCASGDKKIDKREVEKLLAFISTLRDGGEKATCCDHPWTEINLDYSAPPRHKKITVEYDLTELKELFSLCDSPSVSFNPDDPASQRRLAAQLNKVGVYDRAAAALERARELDPEPLTVEMHEMLGETYRMLGNHEKAIDAYKRALGLRPDSSELFLKLGSLYSEAGRLPEAIEAYSQALRLAPTGPTAYEAQASIGYVYEEQGRFADAAKAFEEVLRAQPDDAFDRYSLGKIYLELGDLSSALEQYKVLKSLKASQADDLYILIYTDSVRRNPDDPDARFNLGNAYYWAGRYAEAVDPYKQAVRLKPDLELAYSRLGTAYAELGQYEPAIEACEAAIRLNPQDHIDRVNAGLMHFYLGKHVQAIALLKEATRLKPDSADALNNLGYVLRSTGADREAILSLEQAIRLDAGHELAHYNLGVARQNLGEYREAIEALREAARLEPSHQEAHFELGQAYAHLGRYREAVEAFEAAIALKPNFVDARFQLGSAYFRMGNHKAALKEYGDLKVWDEKRAEELYSLIREPTRDSR